MMIEIRMPEVAADMTEADVVDWLAAPGDPVTQGEILFEIETDKSTVEIEAPATGVLQEIRVPAGTLAVPVGEILAVIEASASAEEEAPRAEESAAPRAEEKPLEPPELTTDSAEAGEAGQEGAVTEAPSEGPPPTALARRLAERAGLDPASVQGSGARGRVLRADIEGTLGGPDAAGARPDERTGIQSRPAVRVSGDTSLIHLGTSCRIEKLVDAVARLSESRSAGPITLEAGVVRAVAMALAEVPELTATDSADTETTTRLTLSRGSQEPDRVLVSAERMGLAVLSDRLASPEPGKELATSGLGLLHALESGVDRIDPSLLPGQVCALGVGSAHESPVVQDGELVAGKVVEINLAADGRVVSPELATRFLATLRRVLEHPLQMAL